MISKAFTRGAGVGGIQMITQIAATFYNEDATVDSTVITDVTRPNLGTDDIITECESPFFTTESEKL